jgi:dTDP-4-dehydrorhamnose 3,5-epimerase
VVPRDASTLNVVETPIAGVLVFEAEPVADVRGSFARTWERAILAERQLEAGIDHVAVARNRQRGTLRGLHFQLPPYGEAKTVQCLSGSVWDVAVDLRADSATRGTWFGIELTAANQRQLYVPVGCAHGYITLADDTTVQYLISAPYSPEHASGVRWDDPSIGVEWPAPVTVMSDRDRTLAMDLDVTRASDRE